jgi:hypothetical protein
VISQISNNKSFEQLVGFLSQDSDSEYISKNIHPLIFLKEKFTHLHELNPDLSGDYKRYIDLYMNQKKQQLFQCGDF